VFEKTPPIDDDDMIKTLVVLAIKKIRHARWHHMVPATKKSYGETEFLLVAD
jgi:hypothetical protein